MKILSHKSIKTKIALGLWALSACLIVAWLVEAWIKEFGLISQYVAPVGVTLNLVAGMMLQPKAPKRNG